MIQLSLLVVFIGGIGFSKGYYVSNAIDEQSVHAPNGSSTPVNITRFENVTTGIYDAWKNSNPENVNGRLGSAFGNGKLWLVSRRLFRRNFDDPWDPATRGGIVSTFHVPNTTWVHKAYSRVAEDKYGDKLFSLGGRLFMLTYSTNMKKIGYHKLFFWNDESAQWVETPFEIDPTASTISTNEIESLSVNVPDQGGRAAYLAASAHVNAQRGSEMAFSKLDVQFRGNVPIKATLKSIARATIDQPSAVVFTAVKGDVLYALVENFFSEGYVPESDLAHTVDLKTGRVGNVSLGGTHPRMDFDGERMFQIKDQVLIVGGRRMVDLGQMEDVNDIWSLDLNTLQWRSTNAVIPPGAGSSFALDQKNGKLYAAGLREGIDVAQVNA